MRKTGIILSVFVLIVNGYGYTTQKQEETIDDTAEIQDTIIIKHENILNESSPYYSKSYSYHWITGNDTLDFALHVHEWKRSGTFYISVFHKNQTLFIDALRKINECLPLIKEYFDVSKLEWIDFEKPVFYLDLAKKLSDEYEHEFGRKEISQKKLNQFLLKSSLTAQLNDFLNPLNKKVKRYGLEKFFLIDKKDYKSYLPYIDLTEYPEFTFNAHAGIVVELENK